MNSLKSFFKDKLAHFYVLFIIFLIPILIIINGLWRINTYQSNINQELTNETKLTATLISSLIGDDLTTKNTLEQDLVKAKTDSPGIEDITVFMPHNNSFKVFTSTDNEFNNVTFLDSDFVKLWTEDQTIVRPFKNTDSNPSRRSWLGLTSIKNDSGIKQAILAIKLSSKDIDAASRTAINVSLVSLVFTVFIVFLLLVNHFRFFEYFKGYQKIQELDKMKDEFISIVSHELKTPLATVKGYLDMMFQGLTGKFDEKTRQHLIKIMMNVERLDSLINELLDVSRIEQERMQFDMQPMDISKISEKLLLELGENAKNKGLAMENVSVRQMPAIFADPDRVHQILENLVSNAIKYTQKGKITISYKIENGFVITFIKDTGIGMSPEDMKRLFDRFYRIKNEKTMDISGTGLGLWIAKAIASKMNGKIKVESEEGVGSTFCVSFPFIKE